MKLVLQAPHVNACQQACIAMICGVTLEAVVNIVGAHRLDSDERDRAFAHFGQQSPRTGYLVESFGDLTIAALVREYGVLWCTVFSSIDRGFAHAVILDHDTMLDPHDGINPQWPWHRYIGMARPCVTHAPAGQTVELPRWTD